MGFLKQIKDILSGTSSQENQVLKEGDSAPKFSLKTDEGGEFSLNDRRNKGWTVLYFYPKANTPGCTKQACEFRDTLKEIRDLKAEVYGVSTDRASELSRFRKKYGLNFTLLSDEAGEVIEKYGVKMPLARIAKRWTFLIDPMLKIRYINNQVDPIADAHIISEKLKAFQSA